MDAAARREVAEGRRSPSARDAYRRKLDTHVLPALGEVRLGEITTALVDGVIQSIKRRVGAPSARSSRSVISGVLGVAARHGAIAANPVRDAENVPSTPRRRPRALSDDKRREWFTMLERDPKAVTADLPDLSVFLLATGARIGEALGLLWSEVDLDTGRVAITGQVMRVAGTGLVKGPTKSKAGQRDLYVPDWCVEMLAARHERGIRREDPVFCTALGGFRDPSNVRRDLRRARAPRGSQARRDLGADLARARRSAGKSRKEVAEDLVWPRTRVELVESGRVRLGPEDVTTLSDLYGVSRAARTKLMLLAEQASEPSDSDALEWITSHSFRKTNATILDNAGLSARQIADQLGHARPSLTMDVYMGRGADNRAAVAALEQAVGTGRPDSKSDGFPDASRARRIAPGS
jgi:integrase